MNAADDEIIKAIEEKCVEYAHKMDEHRDAAVKHTKLADIMMTKVDRAREVIRFMREGSV